MQRFQQIKLQNQTDVFISLVKNEQISNFVDLESLAEFSEKILEYNSQQSKYSRKGEGVKVMRCHTSKGFTFIYFCTLNFNFGIGSSQSQAKKKAIDLSDKELIDKTGLKVTAKVIEQKYLLTFQWDSKVLKRNLKYSIKNETDEQVVITGCRGLGTVSIANTGDIPITIERKGQATLNLLVPNKNQTQQGGGIELTTKYLGSQLKSYYYIQNSNFGVSRTSVKDAKFQHSNPSDKELTLQNGLKLAIKATEQGYLATFQTLPKVKRTLTFKNEAEEDLVISQFQVLGSIDIVNTAIPITIQGKGQASLNFLIPQMGHANESGFIELTLKYVGFQLKAYYHILNSDFGISAKNIDEAINQSNSASKELLYENGLKLTLKQTQQGYLAQFIPKPKVKRTLTYTNEADDEVIISDCRTVGTTEIVNIKDIPITVIGKGQATFNLLVPEQNHTKVGGGIELTTKYLGLELKSYYYMLESNFGISSKSIEEAKKQSDKLPSKELAFENGTKVISKATESGYLVAFHPKSKIKGTLTYTNETDGDVVISGCRAGGSTQFLNATDLPITVKAKGQASLNFLIPEKNQSRKAGTIELTVKYAGLQMKSYYYIMDENFGASSRSIHEARQKALNSAEKELNYEVKMDAALTDGQLAVKLSRNPKNLILKKGISKPQFLITNDLRSRGALQITETRTQPNTEMNPKDPKTLQIIRGSPKSVGISVNGPSGGAGFQFVLGGDTFFFYASLDEDGVKVGLSANNLDDAKASCIPIEMTLQTKTLDIYASFVGDSGKIVVQPL